MTTTRRDFIKQALVTAFAFLAGLGITGIKCRRPARKVPVVKPLGYHWSDYVATYPLLPFHITFQDDRAIYEDIPTERSMEGIDYKIRFDNPRGGMRTILVDGDEAWRGPLRAARED